MIIWNNNRHHVLDGHTNELFYYRFHCLSVYYYCSICEKKILVLIIVLYCLIKNRINKQILLLAYRQSSYKCFKHDCMRNQCHPMTQCHLKCSWFDAIVNGYAYCYHAVIYHNYYYYLEYTEIISNHCIRPKFWFVMYYVDIYFYIVCAQNWRLLRLL